MVEYWYHVAAMVAIPSTLDDFEPTLVEIIQHGVLVFSSTYYYTLGAV